MSNNHNINLVFSETPPLVMHIDLNSCFTTIEQQANRLLRGKPIAVAAYDTPRGFVLAASYEAKRQGVKLGVNVAEARLLCPNILIMTPDPAKYREAHRRFKQLLLEYTSDVTPKSIDEFVVDMSGSPILRNTLSSLQTPTSKPGNNDSRSDGYELICQAMITIAEEIKQKIYEQLGEAVTVNIGIGPNRFLAKYAAGFNKPNGLTLINKQNFKQFYENMDLVDLPGINRRYKRRLLAYNIKTPLEFLDAKQSVLQKLVFKSIHGRHWYLRLRGYEVDRYETRRGSIGHQYALPHKTSDRQELARLLLKLCEKVGRRLRKDKLTANGIHLYLSFMNYQELGLKDNGFIGGQNQASKNAWHHSQELSYKLYSTNSIYEAAKQLLTDAILYGQVRGMSITVFGLEPVDPEQTNLFETSPAAIQAEPWQQGLKPFAAERRLSDALDKINNRYGEFVLTPGTMMDMQGEILDRIAFGSVRDF